MVYAQIRRSINDIFIAYSMFYLNLEKKEKRKYYPNTPKIGNGLVLVVKRWLAAYAKGTIDSCAGSYIFAGSDWL